MKTTIACKCRAEFTATLKPLNSFLHEYLATGTYSYQSVCKCPVCGEMYVISVTPMGNEDKNKPSRMTKEA